MKNKEIEELLKGMRDVSNTEGCSMNLDRYLVKLLLSYIEQLENNRDKAIEKLVIKQMRYLNEPKYKLTTLDLEEIKNILKGDNNE